MKRKPVVAIILVLVVVLLAGAVAWAMLTNRLVVAWSSSGTAQSAVNVCDTTFVDEYNKVTEYTYPAETDAIPSMDTEGMNKLAERVRATSGYEADPTCQVMLFWTAIEAKDSAAAETALTALKALHAKRAFPDNNLRTAAPLFEYDAALEYLQQSASAE